MIVSPHRRAVQPSLPPAGPTPFRPMRKPIAISIITELRVRFNPLNAFFDNDPKYGWKREDSWAEGPNS